MSEGDIQRAVERMKMATREEMDAIVPGELMHTAEHHVHHEHFIEREKQRVFDDPRELRAFALKCGLEAKPWWETKAESTPEAVDMVLTAARKFESYITGEASA